MRSSVKAVLLAASLLGAAGGAAMAQGNRAALPPVNTPLPEPDMAALI